MRALIILQFFLFSFLAHSQNPEWVTYNNANTGGGLPIDNIDCIAADCTNVIWIGTSGEGIVRYDGITWTNYSANTGSNFNAYFVDDIEVDSNNNLWVAAGQLWKYDGVNWTYSLPPSTNTVYISSIAIENGQDIWVTGMINFNNIIAKFSQNAWTIHTVPGLSSNAGMLDIAVDNNGVVWASSNEGLVKFDGANWTLYDGSNTPFVGIYAHALAIYSNGNLLVGMEGINEFDGTNWTYHNNLPSYNDDIRSFCISGNEIWAGTTALGLDFFNGTSWSIFKTSNSGIPGNRIYGITKDKLGHTWVATSYWGVGAYKQGGVTLGTSERSANNVSVNLFPNPAQTSTTVKLTSPNQEIVLLELKDCVGRTVYTRTIETNRELIIDVSSLSNGVYYFQVEGKGAGKFIKSL